MEVSARATEMSEAMGDRFCKCDAALLRGDLHPLTGGLN
jgi:hypothetical protein